MASSRRGTDWVGEHLALLTSLGAVALVACRLLAISRFDPATASALLSSAGTASVAVGTVLGVVPVVLVLGTGVAAFAGHVDGAWAPSTPAVARFASIVGLSLAFFLIPASLFVLTAIVVTACVVLGMLQRRGRVSRVDVRALVHGSWLLRTELRVLAVLVVLAPLLLPYPWLPLERIELHSGSQTTGYFVGQGSEQLVLLVEEDRSIRYVRLADVERRRLCAAERGPGGILAWAPRLDLTSSLAGLLLYPGATPAYPRCG